MRIVIICGTLEPEMDGVGDYARRLAGELIKWNNEIFLISFYDHYIKEFREEQQEQENSIIPVLRLGAGENEKYRFERARELIKQFRPDWISLQFVPYSYDYRGFPFTFSQRLRSLGPHLKWHVMLHELWVKPKSGDPFKQHLTGFFQKLIIKRMLKNISPVISTNLPVYRERLGKESISLLPLFGNIPLHLNGEVSKEKNLITVVHFGGFTGNIKDFEAQLIWLRHFAEFRNKKLQLLLIGGGGIFKKTAVLVANKALGETYVKDLGRLRSNEISKVFQMGDFGISRADAKNFRKSGSTISMLEHGLPVILRGERNDTELSETAGYENLLSVDDDPKKEYRRIASFSNLEETAKMFCNVLDHEAIHSHKSGKQKKTVFQIAKYWQ